MVNGYVFLDLTKSNVYAEALKVLGTDKPVVIKEDTGAPYFVDSLTLDGTNVVITKGGKTITIANDNTITNVGDIQSISYRKKMILTFEHDEENTINLIVFFNENNKNEIAITSATNELYNEYVLKNVGIVGLDDNDEQLVAFYASDNINNNTFIVNGNNVANYKFSQMELHLV